jgi:hypothetical protein
MADDRPFGYDTLKLRAVFIPQGNPNGVSAADITSHLGHDVVKLRAIFDPDDNPNNVTAADITDYLGHDVVKLRYAWRGSEGGRARTGAGTRRPGQRRCSAGQRIDRPLDARRECSRLRSVRWVAGRGPHAADADADPDASTCRSGKDCGRMVARDQCAVASQPSCLAAQPAGCFARRGWHGRNCSAVECRLSGACRLVGIRCIRGK